MRFQPVGALFDELRWRLSRITNVYTRSHLPLPIFKPEVHRTIFPEGHGKQLRLITYARDKFADERDPFAPALRLIREALAKLDPKPILEPPASKKPYVPSLALQRKNKRRR